MRSTVSMSSGKNESLKQDDAGGFAVASKLNYKNTVESSISTNLQNLTSFIQVQDGIVESLISITNRMGEVASKSTDVLLSQEQRENYNKEFLQLVDQFTSLQNETFNGTKLFKTNFSDEKTEFLESLKNNWLKAAEDLTIQVYGWTVNASDSWDLIINELDTGGYAAFVTTAQYSDGTADVIDMQFDLPDFVAPHTQPNSTADRTVAHEIVHLMQAQNSYYGDITGDGSSRGTWFKEGLAEFIHGADSSVNSILNGNGDNFAALASAIGTGNESWVSGEQYATGYLAVKYLHSRIIASGQADGVKHMTTWMKTQFDTSQVLQTVVLMITFKLLTFRKHPEEILPVMLTLFLITKGEMARISSPTSITAGDFSNADTGSIRGSDEGGATALDAQTVVPDATGSAQSKFIEEENEANDPIIISSDGQTIELGNIDPISFGDTNYYNLSTISGSSLTLSRIKELTNTLTSSRATIGSNLSIVEQNIESIHERRTAYTMSLSSIQDTDFSSEATKLAKAQILKDFNLSTLSQANNISGQISQILLTIIDEKFFTFQSGFRHLFKIGQATRSCGTKNKSWRIDIMSLTINTNPAAIRASFNLTANNKNLQTSLTRLS